MKSSLFFTPSDPSCVWRQQAAISVIVVDVKSTIMITICCLVHSMLSCNRQEKTASGSHG